MFLTHPLSLTARTHPTQPPAIIPFAALSYLLPTQPPAIPFAALSYLLLPADDPAPPPPPSPRPPHPAAYCLPLLGMHHRLIVGQLLRWVPAQPGHQVW